MCLKLILTIYYFRARGRLARFCGLQGQRSQKYLGLPVTFHMMSDTGVLVVQHGDFPFDYIVKEHDAYRRIEGMLQRLSEAARKLDHVPDNDPHVADMRKMVDAVRAAGYDAELGYLDFARPTIAEAVHALAGRGHRNIVVVCTPGLMMRSSHSRASRSRSSRGPSERRSGRRWAPMARARRRRRRRPIPARRSSSWRTATCPATSSGRARPS